MARLQASGFHVLMQLAFSPWFLRSNLNACGSDPTKAAPSDVNAWAALAKAVVAHMDQKFPGMVTDYEIWNEPDSGGMCGTTDKLSTYLALYAATAPALKQQAAADGATIRVGGPALSVPDPGLAPGVAHQFLHRPLRRLHQLPPVLRRFGQHQRQLGHGPLSYPGCDHRCGPHLCRGRQDRRRWKAAPAFSDAHLR